MKIVKYLLIILLVFISGCSNVSGGENTSTMQLSEASGVSLSEPFDVSKFPPSDWPKEPTVTYREESGEIPYQEGIYNDRFWTPEGL